MRWAGHAALIGKKMNSCRIIGGKTRRKETARKAKM
jgi:hypothetical protein